LKEGGTGSRSEHEEQPEFLPDRFESGTPNGPGIAGLLAGVRFVLSHGIEEIRDQELRLAGELVEGLKAIRGVKLYGPGNLHQRMAAVSFNMTGISPQRELSVLRRGAESSAGRDCTAPLLPIERSGLFQKARFGSAWESLTPKRRFRPP